MQKFGFCTIPGLQTVSQLPLQQNLAIGHPGLDPTSIKLIISKCRARAGGHPGV